MLIMDIEKRAIVNLENIKKIIVDSDDGELWDIIINGEAFEFYPSMKQAEKVLEDIMNAYEAGKKTFIFPPEIKEEEEEEK